METPQQGDICPKSGTWASKPATPPLGTQVGSSCSWDHPESGDKLAPIPWNVKGALDHLCRLSPVLSPEIMAMRQRLQPKVQGLPRNPSAIFNGYEMLIQQGVLTSLSAPSNAACPLAVYARKLIKDSHGNSSHLQNSLRTLLYWPRRPGFTYEPLINCMTLGKLLSLPVPQFFQG